MSIAYTGGSEIYTNESPPTVELEVLQLVERFIEEEFKQGKKVAEEVTGDSDKRIIMFADDSEEESPATLGQRDSELVAYGAISYRAREHSVQTIWENQFEIRQGDSGVYVRFSDWYGTTVESWGKKVERQSLYV
jgi:hypothetical protein